MDSHLRNFITESFCSEDSYAHQDIERCPFLRNINEPTNFSFSSFNFAVPVSGSLSTSFIRKLLFKLVVSSSIVLWYNLYVSSGAWSQGSDL